MLLSESYKKRIQELSGIVLESKEILEEKDNREVIVNKIKLPQFVADWAHNISDKYSIWIADILKEKTFDSMAPEGGVMRKLVKRSFEEGRSKDAFEKNLRNVMRRLQGQFSYVSDWLNGREGELAPETDKIVLRNISFENALERAEQWHERVADLSTPDIVIEDEDGEILMTFPDGYYWINLGKGSCSKEGRAMGHCGRGEGLLFSLRKEKHPHVTADILKNGIVKQLRGRANTKPKKKYHPYIIALIKSDYVNSFHYWDYKRENNFWIHDLSKEEIKDIANTKPTVLKNQRFHLFNFSEDEIKELVERVPEIFSEKQIRRLLGDEYFEQNFQ